MVSVAVGKGEKKNEVQSDSAGVYTGCFGSGECFASKQSRRCLWRWGVECAGSV